MKIICALLLMPTYYLYASDQTLQMQKLHSQSNKPLTKLIGNTIIHEMINEYCEKDYKDPNGAIGYIHSMIQVGIDPNTKNVNLQTPLHIAAEKNRIAFVKFFLETHKVDPNGGCSEINFKKSLNPTPLMIACHNHINTNAIDIIETLLEHGANANLGVLKKIDDSYNYCYITPLMQVCLYEKQVPLPLIKALIAKKADVKQLFQYVYSSDKTRTICFFDIVKEKNTFTAAYIIQHIASLSKEKQKEITDFAETKTIAPHAE